MSANTTPSTGAPEKVYVEIPKAGPGQRYVAPKNVQRLLLSGLSRVAIVAACLSLPLAPGIIIGMIVASTYQTEPYLIWLWVTMTILVEVIAIFVAIGIAREALGASRRTDYIGR